MRKKMKNPFVTEKIIDANPKALLDEVRKHEKSKIKKRSIERKIIRKVNELMAMYPLENKPSEMPVKNFIFKLISQYKKDFPKAILKSHDINYVQTYVKSKLTANFDVTRKFLKDIHSHLSRKIASIEETTKPTDSDFHELEYDEETQRMLFRQIAEGRVTNTRRVTRSGK